MLDDVAFPVRNVLLCVSGSVSAALMPAWCYWARQTYGIDIRAALTSSARTFVTPTALSAITGNEVVLDDGPVTEGGQPMHMVLARWAEAVIVAPATGNTVAKLAQGVADNLMCTTVLSCTCPIVVAPSLNAALAAVPSTRRNLERLRSDGCGVVPTVNGPGVVDWEVTAGAMPDAPAVFEYARKFISERIRGG